MSTPKAFASGMTNDPPSPRLPSSLKLRRDKPAWQANGNLRALRLKSNPRLWRGFWRRREKWTQLLVEIAQGGIMEEERAINLREPFHHGAVRGKLVAHLHERADYKHAHLHGPRAVEDVRGLERTVFGECIGQVTDIAL